MVGPGWLLAGVQLEVIIHGNVGGQHLQIQRINVLQGAGGSQELEPWPEVGLDWSPKDPHLLVFML